ncbi:MAG: hypothetical protein ACK5B5_06135, partial [Bacteroidota bacterium]
MSAPLFFKLNNLRPFFFSVKSFCFHSTFYFCVSLFFLSSAVFAQHSNVQVTTLATAGGSWSALTGGTYTFTPNADNANILYTDIEYRLLGYNGFTRGNVRIVTTNGTGTQVGNVNI